MEDKAFRTNGRCQHLGRSGRKSHTVEELEMLAKDKRSTWVYDLHANREAHLSKKSFSILGLLS